MITKKIDSVRALSTETESLIIRNKLPQALKLIHDFVDLIVTEPLCTSQVFGSRALDELCERIGKINFSTLSDLSSLPATAQPVHIYIATKLQKSGGHTRVVENFIKSTPDRLHVVLLTGLEGKSDVDYFIGATGKDANVVLEQSPNADYLQRLTWLQKRLTALAPEKVYLFNHHQDSVAIAAVQPEMGLDAWFYHHADHHLCLGVYHSRLRHIDPHPMGYHNCRDRLHIDNIYVPLNANDLGVAQTARTFLKSGKLTTCTAARSNKIEIPYFVSYLDVIPQLLLSTGGKHLHIGKLSPWALSKIHKKMKSLGLKPEQFEYIEWVPSVWKALHEHQVDLYIASFPYGGGITLIEAMGAGIPVAVHRHIYSQILSCIDLAYPGAFSWRYPEELLKFCAALTPGDLAEQSGRARAHFEQFYSSQHLISFLNDAQNYHLSPNPPGKFEVEYDEWGYWMERQLNLKRLLGRAIYRVLRKVRAGLNLK